jgi:GntR family transcriptional regulator
MAVALPLPKYHQIYLVLLEQLREGRFADGLPSELALSKQFDAGRVTVRRALEQLTAEGLITRTAGRGTWPTKNSGGISAGLYDRSSNAKATRLTGLLENLVSANRLTSVKVIEWRVVSASASVADALRIPVGTKVRKLVRRRSSQEGPVSYITTYFPEDLAHAFGRRELSKASVLQLLEASGVELGRAQQMVSARQADAVVATELQVPVGTALLAVRRLVFDVNDRPVQWLNGLYRPDRYEYQMEITQVGDIHAKISVKENLPEV